jgi:surfeit locus 1 family protein
VGGTLSGAILVTPLTSPAGRPALLVRGWVPAGWTEDHDEICITAVPAVVRASESPSSFVPANDAARGTWHWLDGPALAAAAGLPPDTLLLEVVRPEGGRSRPPGAMDVLGGRTGNKPPPPVYPLPRALADVASVSVTPATHAQYAATWGSLAVATAGLAVKALRK